MTRKGFKETEIGTIPQDWEVRAFGDLLKEDTRNGIYKPKKYHGSGIKMVNMGELFAYERIGPQPMRLVELDENEKRNFLLNSGDLLFARRSLVAEGAGKCSLVIQHDGPLTFESSIIRARPNQEKAEPLFLYYLFRSPYGKYVLGTILRQVAVSGITGKDLIELKLPIPPLTTQHAIGSFLSYLDDKIDLDRQMNATLERIGQALFKHWFVDFEFPNEKGKPYKSNGGKMVDGEFGQIPKGWEAGRLGDICDITMGQSPPGSSYNESGDGMCFYQGITDFGFRFPTNRVFCTAPTRFADEGDVLLSVRAPVGALNVAEERCAVGRGVASVRLKGRHNGFLYYLLLATKSGWETFEAEGTVFGAANKTDVHDFKIMIPTKPLTEKFASIVEPMDVAIRNNEKESRTLLGLRDSLLPRLMSGKIRVKTEVLS